MTIMLDHATQHGGLEKPPDGLRTKTCPKCGSGTVSGFGHMGGGVGPYVICDGEGPQSLACTWFYKEQSKDEA